MASSCVPTTFCVTAPTSIFTSPRFVMRKLRSVRNFQDVRFLFNAGLRVLGHLRDFNERQLDNEAKKPASRSKDQVPVGMS